MHNQFIFLDRDGTIIKDTYYTHKIKELEFLPKAISGLQKLQSLGYQFIITGNQAGVARGYYSLKQAEFFHDHLLKQLEKNKVYIIGNFFCYHDIADKCLCRKPQPGLAEKAARLFNVNLSKSIFVGDKDCDILLGQNFQAKTFLIKNGQYYTTTAADFLVSNLEEMFGVVKNW